MRSTFGLEVIGTLANLLIHGSAQDQFVADYEEAIQVARSFLDKFCAPRYHRARAYSIGDAWCDWFIENGFWNGTLIFYNGTNWWVLAITDGD